MDLREAYTERRQAELDEFDAEIKTFEFKADNVRPDEQMQFYDDLQALRGQYSKTQQKLAALRESGDQGWNERKQNLETAWKDLQNGIERTHKRLQ